MDFDDTPAEATFRAEARAWLDTNVVRRAAGEPAASLSDREKPGVLAAAKAWQAHKAEHGWACLTWPVEFGGRGAAEIEHVIWRQEESRYRVPPDAYTITHGMAGPVLMAHGTAEQQRRWIPAMVRGSDIWCQLFSEPGAGSDVAGVRTRAERDGDQWVVNGQKVWSSGAHYADWGLLVARTDLTVAKHAGLTFFVIDMHAAGVEARPIRQITGASHFNEVFLTDVRIPDEQRVSDVGNGWRVVLTTLMNERSSIGADGVGGVSLPELLDVAAATAAGDAAVTEQLADFYVRTKALEYTNCRILTALAKGATPGPEGSIAKLVSTQLHQQMTSLAVDLQGELGLLLDPELGAHDAGWPLAYLGAPGGRIGGGSDEILRNIIGERVLGLPAEPRVDKHRPFADLA